MVVFPELKPTLPFNFELKVPRFDLFTPVKRICGPKQNQSSKLSYLVLLIISCLRRHLTSLFFRLSFDVPCEFLIFFLHNPPLTVGLINVDCFGSRLFQPIGLRVGREKIARAR